MLLLPLFAAAAVQAAPAPSAPSPEVRQRLACPAPKGIQVTALKPGQNSLHKLADEPDAHMVRPVARNYCEEKDIVRFNVSGDSAAPPSDILTRPATLQPARR